MFWARPGWLDLALCGFLFGVVAGSAPPGMSALPGSASTPPIERGEAASFSGPRGLAAEVSRSIVSDVIGVESPATLPVSPVVLSSSSSAAQQSPGIDKIRHLVFIMQENRSFDSYFGTYPGAAGLPADVCVPDSFGGQCVQPYHDSSAINRGGPHDQDSAVADMNGGRMDGFLVEAYGHASKSTVEQCPPTRRTCKPGQDPRDVMGWHDYRDIPNYWDYAQLYVLQDHMFSSVASFTLPNRLYALAGQSGGYVRHNQTQPANFDFPTIADALTSDGIDWKYYVTSGPEPNPINGHVVGSGSDVVQSPNRFSYFNPLPAFSSVWDAQAQRRRIVDTARFYDDARTGQLPFVCWVAPSEPVSEHPPYSIRKGMAYVTGLVNAVMEGPDWESSAIFISYDEWGGFYDHVIPPRVDQLGLGLRVPGLVISPYARRGYVDHQTYSPASWLRIVEEHWHIAPLTSRDATAADMLDAFDFNQSPRSPTLLAASTQGSPYPYLPPQTVGISE